MTTLLWLRDDLRLADHDALLAACADASATDGRVVALWLREEVPDDGQPMGPRPLGAATRWWYHRSLESLSPRLAELGIPLLFGRGDARVLLPRVAAALGAKAVHWSRRYAGPARSLDAQVKQLLTDRGCEPHSHVGSLLVEPWVVTPGGGGHYSVFTPYHRAAQDVPVPPPLPEPEPLTGGCDELAGQLAALHEEGILLPLDALELLDLHPKWWQDTVAQHWAPGEPAARERLADVEVWLPGYRSSHNLPAEPDSTSQLSPHLRAGELSPRAALHAATTADLPPADRQAWLRQLYWREFCWHLTYHLPDVTTRPMRPRFHDFPYQPDARMLAAWQRGRTGIDLVDAGMRQLWQTGWMHNRVRMVVASLLTKNLLQPWQAGEQWFWDTLVDADEANNPVSWQWVAGSGADAAPYFRVFNPDLQRDKFDPGGKYLARWLGGAADRPAEPVVDLMDSRRRALDAYRETGGEPVQPTLDD